LGGQGMGAASPSLPAIYGNAVNSPDGIWG